MFCIAFDRPRKAASERRLLYAITAIYIICTYYSTIYNTQHVNTFVCVVYNVGRALFVLFKVYDISRSNERLYPTCIYVENAEFHSNNSSENLLLLARTHITLVCVVYLPVLYACCWCVSLEVLPNTVLMYAVCTHYPPTLALSFRDVSRILFHGTYYHAYKIKLYVFVRRKHLPNSCNLQTSR